MKMQWNKVTWYSKILAVILFVLTFYIAFGLGFGWGKEKTKNSADNKTPPIQAGDNTTDSQKQAATDTIPITISSQSIKEENFSGTMPLISGTSVSAVKARVYVEQRIAEFRTQANKDVPDMREKFGADSPPAAYSIDINAKHILSEKTESVVISIYTYTGGANGNDSYKVITASRPDGKILTLADIIKQEKQSAFTAFVQKELIDWSPDTDESVVFPDEVKSLKFSSFTNWSMDDKNLILYFDKYQIGPGYLGAIAFPLPLSKIKDFLK